MWLLSDRCKGTSSHQLARDLGVTQKSAWFLAHRIRAAWADTYTTDRFEGPVEVDETWIGDRATSRHATRQKDPTLDVHTPVIGTVDHDSGKSVAVPIERTNAATLVGFVKERTTPGAMVRTDEHKSHAGLGGLGYRHSTVTHSRGVYVASDGASTNSIESFWSLLKRGYVGTYHYWSRKHLGRNLVEFTTRHNARHVAPVARLKALAAGCDGKRLDWATLTPC
ncbi:IS1595 family transposase [Candidatus Poriferisodalis sp.]|uniref:IS1595 family transposase n=1 Tax=Candidatus Poriferisodalis sp. TaxID=3101277 RepID=UPI003AF9FD64